MEKPTVDEIIGIASKLETEVYGEVKMEFLEDERYYELDFLDKLGLPQENTADGIVLPTARDMVDTAVDHTDISNARVDVTRRGFTKISAEDAEMMRKFYLGMIYRTNTEATISPWRVAAKNYWLYGVAFMKTVWDADRHPDKPSKKSGESDESYAERIMDWQGTTEIDVPIIITAPNPTCIMPDPHHLDSQFFIEKHEKAYFSVAKNYPKWTNPKNKGIGETVEWLEYWDKKYKCFLCDGEAVIKGEVVEHRYKFIPYVQIDSGQGHIDSEGDFVKRWVGMLRYMRDALIAESRSFSIEDIILKQGAYPWYIAKGENAGALAQLDTSYGAVNKILDGVELDKMSPDIPPQALQTHMAITGDIIAAHAAPRSLRGLGESGVRAAADRRLVMSEAAMKYIYSKDAFKYGTARVLANCARLYKNVIPSDIRLWAHTSSDTFDEIIDRDRMKEPFFCHVEFAPISPEDEYRRHDDLRLLVQGLNIPSQWAWGRMPDVDVVAMNALVEKEKISNSPALLQAQDMYIAQAATMAFAQKQALENLQMQQGQPPMGGGMPGQMTTQIPQQAMPGSPTQIQGQRAAMSGQANVPMFPGQGQGGGGANYVR